MNIADIKTLTIHWPKFEEYVVRPFHTPPQWICARLSGDPVGSFTVLSADATDVARAAPNRLLKAEFGDGTHTYWAKMAYATSYPALCAALDLLNLEVDQ